ncbi:uncharacterized protein [Asterias amurensis]
MTDLGQNYATFTLPAEDFSIDNSGLSPDITVDVNGAAYIIGDSVVLSLASMPHLVQYTATDNSTNNASCDFYIAVIDDESPKLTCPSKQTVMTNLGQNYATFTLPAEYFSIDNSGFSPDITVDVNGAAYIIGDSVVLSLASMPHLVQYTATDNSINNASCDFYIAVIDDESPKLRCPSKQTVMTDLGQNYATFTLPAEDFSIDNSGFSPDITVDVNGTAYIIGDSVVLNLASMPHLVQYTATDNSTNNASCDFYIAVIDKEPPNIKCPENIVNNTKPGSPNATVVWPDPIVTDNSGQDVTFFGDEHSGSTFDIGSHVVIYNATDSSNNTNYCNFTIQVIDNEPPSINGCPDDAIIPAASTIPVQYVPHSWVPPVFSDNSGQSVDVEFGCLATISNNCHQDGNGTFSVGDTKVMYNGRDVSGNQNFCNFTVTVKEVDLVCPLNKTISTDPGSSTAIVSWHEPDLNGWDETNFTSSAVSGLVHPIGSQRVIYQQWFGINNLVLTCSFEVDVVDTEPPTNNCPTDVILPWLSNTPDVSYAWIPPFFSDNSAGVRLVGGSVLSEGRVEVFYNDHWGTVCDDEWDMRDASVVCRQLGFSRAITALDSSQFGQGTSRILMDNVNCNGSEERLQDCAFAGWGLHNCGHSEDASVTCDPDVRLVGGSVPSEGRVEVFYDGQWGTVCDDYWDIEDASVVCRQLGFTGPTNDWQSAYFGQGTGQILMDDINCDGNEERLQDCAFRGWGSHDCGHGNDASVTCVPADVRLVGGSVPFEGRVEVFYEGQWGTVCDDEWDITDANVVCRQLGFTGATSARQNAHFGQGTGKILIDDVNCDGNEERLQDCDSRGWGFNDCSHSDDASVTCEPDDLSKNLGQSVDVVFGCSATVLNNCHQDGYGTFSVGDTMVMYNGTDKSGNQNFCNFTVTIKEVDLICPLNVTISTDPGSSTARVNWQEPDLTGWEETKFTSTADSGDFFPIGSQSVTYQQRFGINNLVLTCSFEVDVVDTERPTINNCPIDVIIPGLSTRPVSYTWRPPFFSDNSADARLVAGSVPSEGRVEVLYEGQWGTVCDDFWDIRDANVVCRQLGFIRATSVWLGAHFGPGTGQIHMDDVSCNGTEERLQDCAFSGFGSHNCSHGEDASVACDTDGVRLVEGNVLAEGRVEVLYDGQWGTVCDDEWDIEDASVVCRQLGFTGATFAWQSAYFGKGTGQILMDGVNCNGNEERLQDCAFSGWGVHNCAHGEDASVTCDTDDLSTSLGQSVDVVFGCSETVFSDCYQDGYGTFSVGDTEVMYNGTDAAWNQNFCNFTVATKEVDLICPLNVTIPTDPGSSTAIVYWQEPDLTGWNETNFTSTAVSGDFFPIGSQRVTYQQWFGINNLVLTCSFEVDVVDNEPPGIIGCPDDAIIPVRSTITVNHSWVPPVFTDNSNQSVDVVFACSATASNECHQDGYGTFSVGDTEVMYNGTDASGNQNFCNFTVSIKVVDLVCPETFSVVANPINSSTIVVWEEPHLTGWNGTNFTSTADSGDGFSIGEHEVTYHQWFGFNNLELQCSFVFRVIGQCASEVTRDTMVGTLSWPVTVPGIIAESIERCPLTTTNAGFPRATRNCSTAPPPLFFMWKEHMIQSCGEAMKTVTVEDIVKVDVTEGNAEEVAEFLVNQTSSSSSSSESDVEAISQVLENIVNAKSGNPAVTDAVVETVSNVIVNAKETQDSPDSKSSSAIIQSVEAQVSLTLQQEEKVSIQQDTIHVEAVSIHPIDASNGFSFATAQKESAGSRSPQEGSLDGTEVKTFTNASEVPKGVVASIQLPANINDLLPQGSSTTLLQASFIVYADDTLFQTGVMEGSNGTNNVTTIVAGSIVSLAVEGVELKNLTDPVVINFKILPNVSQEDVDTIKCVFWEFGEESGFWSTEGCQLAEMTDDKVSCVCDHATNFAILVDVKGQKRRDDGLSLTPALDLISQIGGALSVAALAITLVIYLSISKLRTGKSRQIFIHFCFSLLMLYIVFLAGIDNGRGSGGWCVFVGALIHYLSLTTMMWMAVEARNMYVSTVKVFPEDTPRYMIKAGLLAWGSPLIVLTVTLAAATESYQHEDYCFISPGLAMYLGLLTPIALILLHNVITFILVMRSLLKVKEASRSEQITKRLQNAVGISALMGLTWCFGFLAIEGATAIFQLLFCVFNSLQGVVVFVMFCARREEVRAAVAPYLRRICCCRVCQAPELHPDRSYDLPTSQTALGTSSINTASLDLSVSVAVEESHEKYVSTEAL